MLQGRSIRHRLQTYVPDWGAGPLNAFDLDAWAAATALYGFGVELFVTQGAVLVSLHHITTEGHIQEIARLDCNSPGTRLSPAFYVADLRGTIQLVIEDASRDAIFDLYFGTNDLPYNPDAQVAFIYEDYGDAQAQVQAFATAHSQPDEGAAHLLLVHEREIPAICAANVTQIPNDGTGGIGAMGRGLFALLYGSLSHLPATHACLYHGTAPHPEIFARTCSLAQFLRPGIQLTAPAALNNPTIAAQTGWPWRVVNLCDVARLGLPLPYLRAKSGSDYHSRFQAANIHTVTPKSLTCPSPSAPQLAALPPPPAAKFAAALARIRLGRARRAYLISPAYWQRAADNRPPLDTALVRPGITRAAHMHHQTQALFVTKLIESRRLQARTNLTRFDAQAGQLQTAGLLDPTQHTADHDRSNRVVLSLLRGRHKGARAVIVGNGPSLRIADLDRLTDSVTFASNKIYLAYEQTGWRPTYYTVEDHLVLHNNRAAIEAVQGSIKIFPAKLRDFGYCAADTILVPFLPPVSFDDPLSDPEFPAFSADLSHGLAWGSTVVYSQIQMAVFMGVAEIVLIGIDHSYQLPDTKRGNTYVYAGEQNHFHPEYRNPGEIWHQPNLAVLERSFKRAREVCDSRGIRIVNASRQTALEVFERVNFDALFPMDADASSISEKDKYGFPKGTRK